ncbi:ABC transporter ATP-binding protein [Agarivorans sp. B2Z047]|uniref:GNAT family N-acetyltransferase n=1 Tax=Agarivorans sp. B2Z047 TaxID=2652721 RepID=UPI00128BB3E8|nr:GNAT family N-acetyltransferase [Agarivorans sp. B2Z047]MPW31706.1 ABC transporter ATP-binding protein [Agarivorans sp. B2Z047]UQN42334.1 hypothetical protein LQZ07_21565 [Agarivorans sp. B2Z047]
MKICIRKQCLESKSYRAAAVKSLFNVESGASFELDTDLPIDDQNWQIGVIVGPSGSGKTSIGEAIWEGVPPYTPVWPHNKPIIDAIAPKQSINAATAALSQVGLGSVPTWLKPFAVLSNGEQFRANLARLICDAPKRAIVDEFSSVVDRQIARVGASAFAKGWRRTDGQVVLLSCHYDILDWVTPCWVFDTATGQFTRGVERRRPPLELKIYQTDWRFWPLFEKHHYLKLPPMMCSTNYIGTIDGELVAHVAFSTRPGLVEARACRLVIMPEWQGAGVGLRFLNAVCELWLRGENRYNKPMPTLFHTSHPGLAHVLRKQPQWTQVSANLWGGNASRRNAINKGKYGGHFRSVQGFRYLGASNAA